jgi:hypothetical protein
MEGMTSLVFAAPAEDGHDGHGAQRLYHRAARAGFMYRLMARLRRTPCGLRDLEEIEHCGGVRARHALGLRTVEIARIGGSEGRTGEFDARFYPRDERTAARWQSVATARYRDLALPPVELILVEDTYYVRDGHHRVSVSVARGEWYIEARVTVWELAPLAVPAAPSPVTAQPYPDPALPAVP